MNKCVIIINLDHDDSTETTASTQLKKATRVTKNDKSTDNG